ncbi:MAG TPA: restriction endonuclease [Cyanobacteria bacterium UBA11149]|nr:restriction endonuclease [Cyanobacteria bacterium UBA11367]HBE60577.1 restriction endonuclease [Cyanobacteria bacterium UBA11366]HBK64961.1 restriction endonuclease [Cyanobacteria bacterium UBA11166]HBR72915.1 restriction endonuclease [Cyanobacteria bacterium UBA11159]HBS69026.1 restriction endonuclease [Cyanobacteria bacterium UBA11153]HBW89569.1 restriction endonuclease [Cyanobacteria bacterium UBA11149]HCA93416.1 restriction endonuclease [Cyanobacteria bacterium UBA9226]
MPLEIFQVPGILREQLMEFQARQPSYPLTEIDRIKEELQGYLGVYLLYYRGNFSLYSSITYANQNSCCLPIYVGKAETPGKRIGKGTFTGGLVGRLKEHRNSIRQVNNLDIADFNFTVVAMDVDLVAWGEAVLIRHFQPVWCSIISGFGIHPPGKGRGGQMRSIWDEIHRGRSFAEQLPPNPITISSLQPQVNRHCEEICRLLKLPLELN